MDSKTLALVAAIALALSGSMMAMSENTHENAFEAFKTKYGKSYETEAEHAYRLSVYTANMIDSENHNSKDGVTYTRGENLFADLTKAEFKARYLMTVAP